jgi:hemerythrin-like metal-binding protein/diguanylate cyclase (GGDEF)-like protein/PAS domain S-box-containing protein
MTLPNTSSRYEFVIFPWNDNFATGIAIIDEQHKVLVAILNKLANHFVHEASSTANLDALVQELADYADFHFRTEEEIWHQHFTGHPLLHAHEQAHRDFFKKISDIQQSERNLEGFADELFGYLTRWLAFHILDSDKRMALATIKTNAGIELEQALALADQDMTGTLALLIRAVLDMYGDLSASTIELMKQKMARQRLETELHETAEQLAAEKLRASEDRYRVLVNAIPDAVVVAHMPTARIIDVNVAAKTLTGYSEQQLLSMQVFDLHPPDTWDFHRENVAELMSSDSPKERFENILLTASGQCIDVEISVHGPLNMQGDLCLVGVFRDITERKKHRAQLEHVAFFDELTGLLNRNGIKRHLDEVLAVSDRNLLVVHADIDDFSSINALYGSEFGDSLLQAFSLQLNNLVAVDTITARLGGDEFLFVFEQANNIISASEFMQRFLKSLQQPVFVGDVSIQPSVSAGVKLRTSNEQTSSEVLLRQTAHALYLAKVSGRAQFHILDQAQEDEERSRHLLLKELAQGLANHEFVLFYQPKVNMLTGAVSGVEALIRWQHPSKGLLQPGQFMPITVGHPLSVDIDNWVISQATHQLMQWQQTLPDLKISVNLCAMSLQDHGFSARILGMTHNGQTDLCHRLSIEVLESSTMGDIDTAISNLMQCRQAGISVAIDDFGTGFSSLSYLKKLPVDCLKIDQGFVRDMVNSKDDVAIIQGFINISKAFELDTIAEGVETIQQGQLLLSMGCHYAQGYAISKPMPANAVGTWLAEWKTPDVWRRAAS